MLTFVYAGVPFGKRPIEMLKARAGWLVFYLAVGLLMQTILQGTGMAFLKMELSVAKPSVAGDAIHVVCEVLESRATSKADRGTVKTLNTVLNQSDEVVMTYGRPSGC